MNSIKEEFLKRLLATFRIEAEEHIHAISTGLIELEKASAGAQSAELTESIFRKTHSLKGAARSVNLRDVEAVCMALEDVFAALKRKEISLMPESYDLFHKAVDAINRLVSNPDAKQSPSDKMQLKELALQVKNSAKAQYPEQEKVPVQGPEKEIQAEKEEQQAYDENISAPIIPDQVVGATIQASENRSVQVETVRIPKAKLDPLFLQAEEMIQSKIATSQRATELLAVCDLIEGWKTETHKWKIRQATGHGLHYKEWMDWNELRLTEMEQQILAITRATEGDHRVLGRMVDNHLEDMKTILMLPVSSLVEIFPMLVRELARDQNKEVELILRGTDLEVDKRILEELKDPLIHLLRNCVGHGITNTHEREHINKPGHGTIELTFSATESRQLEVTVTDDGSGINLEKVCAAVIKAGFVSREAASKLSTQEIISFIFQSGISTNPLITDISGRGLGMAIVKEKIAKLGGTITVESQPNLGTTFRMKVPLTLSTFRGVLVEAGNHLFVLPTINVERTLSVNKEDIKRVENRETILIDGQNISLVSLSSALGVSVSTNGTSAHTSRTYTNANVIRVVVVAYTDTRIAFHVDEVIGEQQILVKELGKQLKRVRNISGAVVLGSGKVVPVIHVSDLMKSAIRSEMSGLPVRDDDKHAEKIYRLLVVDDSITSRTLIRNIFESAGYQVVTAIDGADAFTKAVTGEFDLIVTDIDMPIMNGFELTAKIRKDKKLGELPVVLVTSLDSRKDQEFGIEVGANAYIIKSSFDQSNLLEVVQRLI